MLAGEGMAPRIEVAAREFRFLQHMMGFLYWIVKCEKISMAWYLCTQGEGYNARQ
jgi:hypothetical protein